MCLSVAIPYHSRRSGFIRDILLNICSDSLVSEIVINDDCTDEKGYQELLEVTNLYSKVRVYRNDKNIGAFHNKYKTVSLCKENRILLLDSDCVIKREVLPLICGYGILEGVILCPSKFVPIFDFSLFNGEMFQASFVGQFLDGDLIGFFNMGNYAFNRENYLSCLEQAYKSEFNPLAIDVVHASTILLAKGLKFFVLKDFYIYVVQHAGHISFQNREKNDEIMDYFRQAWMNSRDFKKFADPAWPDSLLTVFPKVSL